MKAKCYQGVAQLSLLFLLIFTTTSCAHYQYHWAAKDFSLRNSHDGAIEYLVKALQEKPDYEDSINLLNQVLPKAYDEHLALAQGYERKKKYDLAVAEYDKIIALVALVSSAPGNFKKIDVEDKRQAAAEKAIQAHYQHGKSYMQKGKAKEAAGEFRQCLAYNPNYKDAQTLYEKQKKAATKTIAIMPFDNKNYQYPNLGENLTQQVLSDLMKTRPEFLEFVSRDYLQNLIQEQSIGMSGAINQQSAAKVGKLLGVSAFVFGKVLAVNTTDSGWRKDGFADEAKISVYNKEGKKVGEKTVRAKGTIHSRETSARVSGSYQIVEVKTGKILKTEQIAKRAKDSYKYARFSGDERALSSTHSALCGREQKDPKTPGLLVEDAVASLSQQLAKTVFRFFK